MDLYKSLTDKSRPRKYCQMLLIYKQFVILVCLPFVCLLSINAQIKPFDVTGYDAEITPILATKSVTGKVIIKFKSQQNNLAEITLDSGNLEIDSVKENQTNLLFEKTEKLLTIRFLRPLKINETRKISIAYHGTPKFGVSFFPEQNQVYTIFSTNQWMPCVMSPSDRAEFRLKLNLWGKNLTTVGNGVLKSSKNNPASVVWEQKLPIPTYLFGFAIGSFKEITEKHNGTTLRYLTSPQFSEIEVKRIFKDTKDMLDFYESKSGIKYPHKIYTQVLSQGNAQQEMSSFAMIGERFGQMLLTNEKKIWTTSHEFAHQWWGNMVTNKDWTHFWLNEGLTNFMSAAYFEHRFGKADYLSEIERYKQSYEQIRLAGKDKSLVFPDWNKPTREDRALVYDKGAFVIHLLREEIGDELFWKGIKQYTQKFWGKSVVAKDFQTAMESASKKDLTVFFDKYIYMKAI
jgi:aminopeptidase N